MSASYSTLGYRYHNPAGIRSYGSGSHQGYVRRVTMWSEALGQKMQGAGTAPLPVHETALTSVESLFLFFLFLYHTPSSLLLVKLGYDRNQC